MGDGGESDERQEAAEGDARAGPGQLEVFRYVTVEKALLYRAILDVFLAAKARYRIQLRPEDVSRELRAHPSVGASEYGELVVALDSLAHWKNLKAVFDSRDASTLEEFRRQRFLYQLSPEGEEAHKGVVAVEKVFSRSAGRLSAVMLPAITERLEALRAELEGAAPDGVRLYTLLKELHDYSNELAENARKFINDLSDALEALALTDEAFLAYKRAVLFYLDRFVFELAKHQPRIADAVRAVERLGVDRLITIAAMADEAPTPDGTAQGPVRALRGRWDALRSWFLGAPHEPPEADHLRDAALDAINRILDVLERLNERRFLRVNRTADFTRLAAWFASSPDEKTAHALFATAFGQYSARHFSLPCADEDVERGQSWWKVPPVAVAHRLWKAGRRSNPGRPGAIPDYSDAKRALRDEIRRREEQRVQAARRFLAGRLRLSDIERLDRTEFDLLLELLDVALRSAPSSDGKQQAMTPNGRYVVTLMPPSDGALAVVRTSDGSLTAPNYTIELTVRAVGRRASTGAAP